MAGKAAADAATSEAGAAAEKTPDTAAAGTGATGDQAAGKSAEGTGTPKADATAKTPAAAAESTGDANAKQAGADSAQAQKNAPATYAFTIPDEGKAFIADDDLARFEKIARANDWTQEEADAALAEELEHAQQKQAKTIEAWETETKGHKTYGGKQLAETQRLANAAIDKVRPKGHPMRDSFLEFLKTTGGGVNINAVAFFADLGKLLGEDAPRASASAFGQATGKDASKFYDHPSSRKADEEGAKTR